MRGQIKAGEYQLPPNDRELDDAMEEISNVWSEPPPDKHLHLYVTVPGEGSPTLFGDFDRPSSLPQETRELWPAVTISAPARGDLGGQVNVERNVIVKLSDTEPDFLMEFRTKLRQRRWIDSDTDPAFLRDELHGFDNYFQATPTGAVQRDRVSSKCQLYHLVCAFLHRGWKTDNLIKEDNVRWIFDELGLHFHLVLGSRESHAFRGDWQFKLIVFVDSLQKKVLYTPRSYFHLSVDRLVYLFVEVQSDTNQSDRYRMLLHAACAARLGYLSYNNPFIVVALYIENSGRVTRYFVFQRDGADHTVSYVSDVQDWMQPSTLFTAIFEIYNLVSIIESDRPDLRDMKNRIELLDSELLKNFDETFMGNALRRGEYAYHDRQVVDAFTQAGYTLESNDEDEDGWAPLNQLKPTMRHAIHSNGTEVVVKLLHDSHELQILQDLHRIDSPINHTIPLLGTLKSNTWTFVLLPEATPLDEIFAFGMIHYNVVDFSQQLIEGVAFLHSQGIAHLDIKPQNIVVLRNQLFIIDFDISVRVDGPSALIDCWCGTRGWMAPEIGHRDGPKCWYSPIRADLWSCGLVLRYLAREGNAEEENPFEALTWELLNKMPRLRPLLHRLPWLHRQSSFTVGHSLSEPQDTTKRKPDTLPHDAKRLAIGSVLDTTLLLLRKCACFIPITLHNTVRKNDGLSSCGLTCVAPSLPLSGHSAS
ncbi:hypothetical protein V8E52_010661 [Russula decolorans]